MVAIAIAGAASQLAREVIDTLAAAKKHEIIALIRQDPADFPAIPGVKWVQTTYEDKSELVGLLKGIHTVLCFFAVHKDPGSETQKRLIDAAVEAKVKRYAPSEWSTGEKLEASLDILPWYAGKVEIAHYLKNLGENKILEITKFQTGAFTDFLGHPHKTSKHIITIPFQFNFETRRALLVEGALDSKMTYTTVQDIANVVARAVEYEGIWPTVGGIRGDEITIRELLKIAENTPGGPFTVDWLREEDLAAGELKTDNYARIDVPSIPKEEVEAFSKTAAIGVLRSYSREVWNVSNDWNLLLPDYKFTSVQEYVEKVWVAGKTSNAL